MRAHDMVNVNYAQKTKLREKPEIEEDDADEDAAPTLDEIQNLVEARGTAVDKLLAELRADEPRRDRAIHEALLRAI